MRGKLRRQEALRRLVLERSLSSQNEMVQLLLEAGYKATQSSISRDVRELGLVRVRGRYMLSERLGPDHQERAEYGYNNELIINSEPIGANLLVIHTPPGAANTVAIELDQQRLPGIAGTLAGDDTIFVAVRSRSAQGRVLAMLRRAAWARRASVFGRNRPAPELEPDGRKQKNARMD